MNMTNEETYIKSRLGKREPFRVPDGYFEHFADKLIQQLPQEKKQSALVARLRPWLYAAACACLVVGGVTLYMNKVGLETTQQHVAAVHETVVQEELSIDEAADYAMLDNQDIYACLMSD